MCRAGGDEQSPCPSPFRLCSIDSCYGALPAITPRELFLTAVNIGYELECHKIHQSLNLSSIFLKISD